MEPQYLGIVNNEQTSDGSGFVVITRNQSELEEAVQDVLCELIKHDLEWELRHQSKESDQVDYDKVPAFVRKHTAKLRESERFNRAPSHLKKLFEESNSYEQFFLEADEQDYENEFGLSIEYGDGFSYNVELYDLSNLPSNLKTQLSSLEPNKFIYLYEMDTDLEVELKEQLDLSF